MSADHWFTVAVAVGIAGYLARGLLTLRMRVPPEALMKINVRGQRVPAVIGGPMVLASLMVLAFLAIAGLVGWSPARPTRMMTALAIVTAIMAVAGSWDDRRGDERARGFKGHLGAARTGALTGGIVKIVAAVVAGLAVGVLFSFHEGFGPGEWRLSTIALLYIAPQAICYVGLTANLVNLTDRAPGRAAKVTLLLGVPLLLFGSPLWAVGAAPLVGALVGCFPVDLKERAMLGDAGANPLGAAIGLGLMASIPYYWGWVVIVLLLALNLASEKWSFSRIIERTPPLRWVDSLGRERTVGE